MLIGLIINYHSCFDNAGVITKASGRVASSRAHILKSMPTTAVANIMSLSVSGTNLVLLAASSVSQDEALVKRHVQLDFGIGHYAVRMAAI